MDRFRIMVDLDGVVYQWSHTARYMLAEQFGLEPLEDPLYWNHIMDQVQPDQWAWLWTSGVEEGLFRHGNVYKGSFRALNTLAQIGDITVITHRPRQALQDTLDWLAFHKIPATNLHILYDQEPKSSIQPHSNIYVDDKPENCIDLAENTEGVVCLWSRPSNLNEQKDLPPSIRVIDNWDAYIKLAHILAVEPLKLASLS